eukprot:2331722-Prymnesium_polylepis.1
MTIATLKVRAGHARRPAGPHRVSPAARPREHRPRLGEARTHRAYPHHAPHVTHRTSHTARHAPHATHRTPRTA